MKPELLWGSRRTRIVVRVLGCLLTLLGIQPGSADDWPMLGRDQSRNSVVPDAEGPIDWQVDGAEDEQGNVLKGDRGIRWSATLGSYSIGQPVISGNLVWLGTNNERFDGQKHEDASVLLCLDRRTGEELYRYVSQRRANRVMDWPYAPLGSSPLIEGDLMWFTTNRTEMVCLDIGPLRRGEGNPTVEWKVDMIEDHGVFPHGMIMFLNRTSSPASHEDWVYVTTNNGVDESHTRVPAPHAPSVMCFRKLTGEVVWTDNTPGANTLHFQTSSPLVIEVDGESQVVVAQGDGWLRAFDPAGDGNGGSKILWEFDMNPKVFTPGFASNGGPNNLLATPIFHEGRIYLASGQEPEYGDGRGRLCCIDPAGRGDVSSELAVDADGKPLPRRRGVPVDAERRERALANPNSRLVWERSGYGGRPGHPAFDRSIGDVAISRGLLVAVDTTGKVYCLNPRTGQEHWIWDSYSTVWGGPLIVGDRIYVGNEEGEVHVFGLSSDPEAALRRNGERLSPLATIYHGGCIYSPMSFVDGTLYIAADNRLHAVEGSERLDGTMVSDATAHWPQWRGPHRDNISTDRGLLTEWPEGGPPLRWRTEGIGEGIASVAIRDGRVITLGYRDDREFVSAVASQSGEPLWMSEIGPAVGESSLMRWLGQRTPTIDEERVYAVRSDGDIVCLAVDNGREMWRTKCVEEFGTRLRPWGFCDYPLVDGDHLICRPGGSGATVVALDRRTGDVIWKNIVPESQYGHAATVAIEAGGLRQYVTFLAEKGLLSVAADDGRTLWLYEGLRTRMASSLTPMVRGELILASSGYGANRALLKLERDGDRVTVQERYVVGDGLSPFQDSTMWIEDRSYAFRSGNKIKCDDAETGEPLFESELPGRSFSMTSAEGILYVRSAGGSMMLVKAEQDDIKVQSQFEIPDYQKSEGASNPVVTGGRLWLRSESRLFCYDLRKHAPPVPATTPRQQIDPGFIPSEKSDGQNERAAPRSVFVPTPHDVAEEMLRLAAAKNGERVYDLGSGDGRIVIAAAKTFGATAVGYEINRELVAISRRAAAAAGVQEKVTFVHDDLFKADLSDADVVAVFLLPRQLEALRPQFSGMKAGARIVSHQFEIPEVAPDRTIEVKAQEEGTPHPIHLYKLPLRPVGEQ